jgi:hypothetical protein
MHAGAAASLPLDGAHRAGVKATAGRIILCTFVPSGRSSHKGEKSVSDYPPLSDRATRVMIALIALLVSVPLLAGAIYDLLNPQTVAVGDYFLPDYEQFRIDRYERMTDRDLAFSGLRDEAELRRAYDEIARDHQKLAAEQIRRRLFMWGSLFIASFGYILLAWWSSRRDERRHIHEGKTRVRRGIEIKPQHRPVSDPAKERDKDEV